MQFDFSADYLLYDNAEAITYQSVAAASRTSYPIATAVRLTKSAKERAPSNAAYVGADLQWLVSGTLLPVPPKPGDQIQDAAGVLWTVQTADYEVLDKQYLLDCLNLAIVYQLQDTITIERPTISYDGSGVRVKTWPPTGGSTPYQNLAARVQPLDASLVDERGLRGLAVTHACIVSQQVSVTNEDRINLGGVYYEIRGYHNPARVDELPVIDAELVP